MWEYYSRFSILFRFLKWLMCEFTREQVGQLTTMSSGMRTISQQTRCRRWQTTFATRTAWLLFCYVCLLLFHLIFQEHSDLMFMLDSQLRTVHALCFCRYVFLHKPQYLYLFVSSHTCVANLNPRCVCLCCPNSATCILCASGCISGAVLFGAGAVREPHVEELQWDEWNLREASACLEREGEEGDVLLLTRN
jgi:hypothetical protein